MTNLEWILLILINSSILRIIVSEYKNIIVFHPRKASGTTVHFWMWHYRDIYNSKYGLNITVMHFEGYPWVHRKQNMIEYVLTEYKDDALFIISFRDPIKRILSQYDFEWRWGCQKCNYSHKVRDTNLTERNYMAHRPDLTNDTIISKYKFSNIDFSEFLHRVEKYEIYNDYQGHRVGNLFTVYLKNYYLWLFCCKEKICRDLFNDKNIDYKRDCLKKAKKMIESMDIILITEWMNDRRMIDHADKVIKQFLSIDESESNVIPPWRQNHYSSTNYNRMISEDNYAKLLRWNAWDMKFYKYVKRVAYYRSLELY